MSVTYDFYHLEGCTAGESLLCQEFAQTFVRCAAGVIFSAKPVALFSFAPTSAAVEAAGAEKSLRSALRELVRVYARELAPYGISLEALLVRGERTTLVAYREDLVAAVLADADDRAFLAAHGFATTSSRSLVRSMREKLAAYYRELAARPKAPADARLPARGRGRLHERRARHLPRPLERLRRRRAGPRPLRGDRRGRAGMPQPLPLRRDPARAAAGCLTRMPAPARRRPPCPRDAKPFVPRQGLTIWRFT